MNKVTSTTFLVSDVEPATTPLLEVPYKEALEALLRTAATTRRPRSMETCARYHGQLISGVPFHPVVAAAHRAFMDHRTLCLSPDIIWLMICQGVANHINANAEELRTRFVPHEGKIQISVRRDDFVKGSPENSWAEAIEEFTKKVKEHIGSAFDLFQQSFTTTGPVERAVAGVVLLDTMQSYFDYDMDTLCGIPAITLEGTPEDWQAVADRAEQFGSLDLEWWLEPLRGILQQFVAASQGVVDRPFWQSLYKYHDESGGPMITGWISALFPYLTDSQTGLAIHKNPYLTLNSQRDWDDEIDDIDIDEEIEDIEVDEGGDDEIIESPNYGTRPTPHKQPNRLVLRREQESERAVEESSDLNGVIDVEHPNVEQLPRRIVPTTQQGTEGFVGTDPDLDDDFEADDDSVVGAWLRPMPRRSLIDGDDDLDSGLSGPRISDLPLGLSKVPFGWDYLDQSFDMEFLGGFVGVTQDQKTLTLRPEIGWAVREAPVGR